MTKTKTKKTLSSLLSATLVMAMVLAYFPSLASAAQITDRSVVIGTSQSSALTSYNFSFTLPSSTTVQSVKLQACDTAAGACTQTGAASGFSSSTPATLNGAPTGLGSGGTWTIDTSDATSLRILNSSNTGTPGVATVNFDSVVNPSAANSTFFIRITSYSDDAWTTPIDAGVVATSTAGQITVNASVDETLTFTLSSATVSLGTLTSSSTGANTSALTVATNANAGYSVGYNGTTLTSGLNTIDAMAVSAASTQNSKQFGINMMANTTPAIGSDISGAGTGVISAGYGVADQFKFNTSGEVIATATGPTNANTFTTSYIANIDDITAAGLYSTVITYTATANF